MNAPADPCDVAVNGERRTLPGGSTLAELLRAVDIDPVHAQGIAVAVNDTIVRRQAWPEVTLQEGDRIEIVNASQGG
ncbi:MAG: sulfur carrier protein ThiS [Rhodothermales bacterium]